MRSSRKAGLTGHAAVHGACHSVRASFESLEQRSLLATFAVLNTSDSGSGSLRDAIFQAEQLKGRDTIVFKIPSAGRQKIVLARPLETIEDPLIIDGTSQPGYQVGAPVVEVDGSQVPDSKFANGLTISAQQSAIRGLMITRFPRSGILLLGGKEILVEGNFIGTDGQNDDAGNGLHGVQIVNSGGHTIGGSELASRNVISGNGGSGIHIAGAHNTVLGNYIGTSPAGDVPLGNGADGVSIHQAAENTIGGAGSKGANLISGNLGAGVRIAGDQARLNVISANLIGTNREGNQALANHQSGVAIDGAPGNTVGGTEDQPSNVISGNLQYGVSIMGADATGNSVIGNRIGTSRDGGQALGNRSGGVLIHDAPDNQVGRAAGVISGNLISANGEAQRGSGVTITGLSAKGNVVQGNLIGTDIAGARELGNRGDGVAIEGSSDNLIGGTDDAHRNVISANAHGVRITNLLSGGSPGNGTANQVLGNFIGTDLSGDNALGNRLGGIKIDDAPGNAIGAVEIARKGPGNLIAGNHGHGVEISGADARDNVVQGNFIGLKQGSRITLPNAGDGVRIDDAPANKVGGVSSQSGNIISGNQWNGIHLTGAGAKGNLLLGNRIGTQEGVNGDFGNGGNGVLLSIGANNNVVGGDTGNVIAFNAAGVVANGQDNPIVANSIFANGGRGIDLGGDGLTLNDLDDGDAGPHGLQNWPFLTGVTSSGSTTVVRGILDSAPETMYRVDFYVSGGPDSSGLVEGAAWLGFLADSSMTTDAKGLLSFMFTTPRLLLPGEIITATATPFVAAGVLGGTSEFSQPDTDGDGLLDVWETRGIDFNNDGTVDLDLAALGAKPLHKDLFVEIDAMLDTSGAIRATYAPERETIDRVTTAFETAPVGNPDGAGGIALHILLEETDIPAAPWPNAWAGFDLVKNGPSGGDGTQGRFGSAADRASANWPNIRAAKLLAFRYCVFAESHGSGSSSGLAELPGNDFMVTLGHPRWAVERHNPSVQAGTFMHELGHTLGLEHGGSDDINFKPNYHSVMNYTWSFPVPLYDGGWQLDYSRQQLPTLDERALIESAGIGGNPNFKVPVGWFPYVKLVPEGGHVEWSLTHTDPNTPVDSEINSISPFYPSQQDEVLVGHDDWSNLRFTFFGAGFADGPGARLGPDDDLPFDFYEELLRLTAPAVERYVAEVYRDLLGRAADALGLDHWIDQLNRGAPRGDIARQLTHSDEYFATVIRPAYRQFLGREADEAGLGFWIAEMHQGLTDERLQAGFIGSAEYYAHAGGTDRAWVEAMYADLLGRAPDAGGRDYWVAQLAQGASRTQVAHGFSASLERAGARVRETYFHYLGRSASDDDVDFWVGQYASGVTTEDIISGFIASDEYFRRANGLR